MMFVEIFDFLFLVGYDVIIERYLLFGIGVFDMYVLVYVIGVGDGDVIGIDEVICFVGYVLKFVNSGDGKLILFFVDMLS